MAFDLDNEELRATRKLHKINDDLYEETSDKNVGNIEDDVKIVKRYLENSAYKESDSDFFKNGGWEIVDLEIPKAMANILAKLEQKDKRIQELEEELEKANKQLDLNYVDDNYITKEKVKELEEESKKVLDLIFEYGQIDGGHHKMWVIDQIVRILTKDKYNEWIKNYVYDEETGDIYDWDKGIAP